MIRALIELGPGISSPKYSKGSNESGLGLGLGHDMPNTLVDLDFYA